MNRKIRLAIAALLSLALVLTVGAAWAAPKFLGTGGSAPDTGSNTSGSGSCATIINMVSAIITSDDKICDETVKKITTPVPAPQGKKFVSDVFEMTTGTTATICYAFPPAPATGKIYSLNTATDPDSWDEVTTATTANGQICTSGKSGTYALIGDS